MKKIVLFLVLMVSAIGFCGTTCKVGIIPDSDLGYIYYHVTSDFNDANTLVVNDTSNTNPDSFTGVPLYIIVDANGTDTAFDISLYVDMTELTETQVAKLYLLKAFTGLTTANDYSVYVINCTDESSNVYGSLPLGATKLYINRDNCASTLDDLKVWVIYKRGKVRD